MASEPNTSPDRQILTVTQLNRAAKNLLETYLPLLWVEGELSNVAMPSSGHWYFTLKDAKAQVKCAMFKNRNFSVRFKPEPGTKVLLRARVSLYEGRGDFQLIVEHMEPAGFGDLQRQFEALKARLQAEGLFDSTHKKPIPPWPKKLGVITSPTGAAIQDILHVLARRFPALPVALIPVAVQGQAAAGEIAQAIDLANQRQICDLLIVGRGGGSLEDLWAFNEEVVARAIARSQIPIVSAVGHEIDFTIADFVADLRAPTPSAAAELVSPDATEVRLKLAQLHKALSTQMVQRLRWAKQQLHHTQARLQHPGQTLRAHAQRLDHLEMRLNRAMRQRLGAHQQALTQCRHRLLQCTPRKQLRSLHERLDGNRQRLLRAAQQNQANFRQRYQQAVKMLHSVSPLNTLQRGYAIVLDQQQNAVRSSQEVAVGDTVTARLKSGSIRCEVRQRFSED